VRALGIEITGSDTLLAILDGTSKQARVEVLSSSRLPLPPDPEQVNRLMALQKQIRGVFVSEQVERVGVIRADKGCSPVRAKIECIIQLAAAEVSIPCKLVAPQTISAIDKRKLQQIADPQLQLGIEQISPGYLRKAACCAWSLVNDEQQ